MTRILPNALTDSITHKVREREQAKIERTYAGGDGLDALSFPPSEAKPHGPLVGLPMSVRGRQALDVAMRCAPTIGQARSAAIATAKFAGLAAPLGCAGILVGAANYYIAFGPTLIFFDDEPLGDAHPMATVGLVLGLTEGVLLATKRYEFAAALAAGIGTGTVANFVSTFLGSLAGAGIALVGGESMNLWRWYMHQPIGHHGFGAIFRVISPVIQGISGLAGATVGAVAVYDELRPEPVADASARV